MRSKRSRSRMGNVLGVGLIAVLIGGSGCATLTLSGDGARQQQKVVGSVAIRGDGHELTLLPGSDVPKLSILGDGVRIRIQEGAVVEKIEVAGDDNEIACPADLAFEYNELGDDNRVVRY